MRRGVLLRKSNKVTNNLRLRDIRKWRETVPSQSTWHGVPQIACNLLLEIARSHRTVASLSGLRFLDNQGLVPRGLMIHYIYPLKSFVIRPENRSIASPVWISVTQRRELSPSSGKSLTRLLPPCIPARRSLRLILDVMPRARLKLTTNSW